MFRSHTFFNGAKHPYSHRFELLLNDIEISSSIKIEVANESDVKELADIAKETYRETYTNYNPIDREKLLESRFGKEFIEKNYFAELNSNQVKYFKVTCNNKIIGFAKLFLQDNNIAKLDKLYVLKAYQRQKLGTQLVYFCFENSIKRHMNTIQLIISSTNENAIAFYQKHGFYKTGISFVPNIPNSGATILKNEVMECKNFTARYQANR